LINEIGKNIKNDSIFLDIGANIGNWSSQIFKTANIKKKSVYIHAFEPCEETRKILIENLGSNFNIEIYPYAMSNFIGESKIFVGDHCSGTNSLHKISGDQSENVKVMTVDNFISEKKINNVSFLKIDVEGFDALVLQGCINSMNKKVFDLIQFEYNWRWILNSQNLRNIFEMIEFLPYHFGKLAKNKILIFDKWHFEMDRFFENNYILIRKEGPFEHLGIKAFFDANNSLCY